MYEEEEDEDYLNDMISLNYAHIKTEIIDLATSSDDEPEDDKSKIGISWYGNRSFVLPITFFDVASNVEFLKECRPLSVKVVDCDKHPSYYKKLLRPKNTEGLPILTQSLKEEFVETEKVEKAPEPEIEHSEISVHIEKRKELKTKVLHLTRAPDCFKRNNETDPGREQVSLKNYRVTKPEHDTKKPLKVKDPAEVHLKSNKDLIDLVVTIQHSQSTGIVNQIYSNDKIANDERTKKDRIKDVGSALRNKLDAMITGLIEKKTKDSPKQCNNNNDGIQQVKESSKNKDDRHSHRNDQNSEGSPTRCSIKMTSSKAFEKVLKLKKKHYRKDKDLKNVDAELNNRTLVAEKTTTNVQTVPKLSLKRKKSEHKEFYVINPGKEKTKTGSPNKTYKITDETQERLLSKCTQIKTTNEIQGILTSPKSKLTSSMKESVSQSTLTGSPSSRKSENYRKSDVVKPFNDAPNVTPKVKSNRSDRAIGKDTKPTAGENKSACPVSPKKKVKNQAHCNSEGRKLYEKLVNSKPLVMSTKSVGRKPDEKLVNSKTNVMSTIPAQSDTFSANKNMENSSILSEHIQSQNNIMSQNNISNENMNQSQYLVIQKTPPAQFQSSSQNTIRKVHEKSNNCQVQSNIYFQKPIEPTVPLAQSNVPNVTQTEKTTSLDKGLQFPVLKQSWRKDMINRFGPYAPYPESQINSLHQNLYSTHKNVNPNAANGNAKELKSSPNLKIPTNIIIRHPNNVGHQMPNQVSVAKDSNIGCKKIPPPPSFKEIGGSVQRPQGNEMQAMPKSTPANPVTQASNCSNTGLIYYYNKPPVNKAIIIKSTPARAPLNVHPNYVGNPIPTILNQNVYHPRMPVVKPMRFLSSCPPPNTNVAYISPPTSMENTHYRMPFVATSFPRHPMYTEHWQQPIYGNYGNHLTCPPQHSLLPPPPPLPQPLQQPRPQPLQQPLPQPLQQPRPQPLQQPRPQPLQQPLPQMASPSPELRNATHTLPVACSPPTGTVIGSNAEGQLIKKITLSAVPAPEPPVVHDKDKMLAELNNAVEELEATSDKRKTEEILDEEPEPKKLEVAPKDKAPKAYSSKPCPLSKKKNVNYSLQNNQVKKVVEEKRKSILGQEAKGYSPPILPIPSYQQAFEILTKNEQKMADILKKMETINPKEKVNKQISRTPVTNKVDKDKEPKSKSPILPARKATKRRLPALEEKKDEPKKISIEEYKRKLAKNDVIVSNYPKSKCKRRRKEKGLSVDSDLGYDSDATLVL